jgi:hypothetical protein
MVSARKPCPQPPARELERGRPESGIAGFTSGWLTREWQSRKAFKAIVMIKTASFGLREAEIAGPEA